jgi:3-oxoacyl-[acyl-carrier protein] reductase
VAERSDRRVALVTGAAGGLGLAVARLLAASGHDLALVDIRADTLAPIADELRHAGGRVQGLPADLADADECERVVAETIARLGRVDVLVNAAAILARTPLEEVSGDSFDRIFHVNCRAPFFLARAVVPDVQKRGWGRIVNVTSIGVHMGGMSMTSAPYEASKGAVAVLTKMFARYGAAHGILVNTVSPGGMRTAMLLEGTPEEIVRQVEAMIPLGRLAEPEEVARMVVWLAGDEASYATGATFDVNGGIVMPG